MMKKFFTQLATYSLACSAFLGLCPAEVDADIEAQKPVELHSLHTQKPAGYRTVYNVSMAVFSSKSSPDPKYLFLKRSRGEEGDQGKWDLPGGKIEKGESAKQAIIREVFEEVGYSLCDKSFKPVCELYLVLDTDKKLCAHTYVFLVNLEAPFEPLLNDEHSEFKWISWEKAQKLPLISTSYYKAVFEKIEASAKI